MGVEAAIQQLPSLAESSPSSAIAVVYGDGGGDARNADDHHVSERESHRRKLCNRERADDFRHRRCRR